MYKGFKCLDPSISHIYISRDVIFDEKIPFVSLGSKTGAQYTAEFLLLPEPIPGNNTSSNSDESSSCFPLPVSVSDVQQHASNLPPQASGHPSPATATRSAPVVSIGAPSQPATAAPAGPVLDTTPSVLDARPSGMAPEVPLATSAPRTDIGASSSATPTAPRSTCNDPSSRVENEGLGGVSSSTPADPQSCSPTTLIFKGGFESQRFSMMAVFGMGIPPSLVSHLIFRRLCRFLIGSRQ
jgi:hypothetical protein